MKPKLIIITLLMCSLLALVAVDVYADEMAANSETCSLNLATGMSLMLQMDTEDYGYIAIQAVGSDLTGTVDALYFYPSSSQESGRLTFTATADTTAQINFGNTLIQPTWNSDPITVSGLQYEIETDGQYTLAWLSPYVVGLQADTANLMSWIIIFALMAIPAGLFIVFFKMGVMGGAIGLLIGTGLAYMLFSDTVPLWLVFTVVLGDIALIYANMRRNQ